MVPGPYGFIAQLNEGRASNKRPTEVVVDQVGLQMLEKMFLSCWKLCVAKLCFIFSRYSDQRHKPSQQRKRGPPKNRGVLID